MKKLRLSSHPRVKVGCNGPLGFARAQPCLGGSLHVRGYLPSTWKNLEILVWKSDGTCHSIWEASENMGCDLRQCNFSTLFSLLSWFGHTLEWVIVFHHVKFCSSIFMFKISTWAACVNGKHPSFDLMQWAIFYSSNSKVCPYHQVSQNLTYWGY